MILYINAKTSQLKYLVKTEIGGIEIRVIESQHGICVIYGMQRKSFTLSERKAAFREYKSAVNHALVLA